MNDVLSRNIIYGNTLMNFLSAAVTIVFGVTVLALFKNRLLRRLGEQALKTEGKLDDFFFIVLPRTVVPLLYFAVFYLGLRNLIFPAGVEKLFHSAGIIFLTFSGIRFVSQFVNYLIFDYWVKQDPARAELETQLQALTPAISIVVWAVGLVFMMDNLGFKISAVIAGLGIGGVAIALASQAVLADLFSYFAIMFDKPFVIGDFIIVNNFMGSVEYIGIKTTRIRSLSGEQLVFSNKQLTDSIISNYKRMRQRRVVFKFGITYETPNEKLAGIPETIKAIITAQPETRFDRAHFASFGASSLDYEVVYFVLTDDFNKYMDIQQQINLKLKETFESRKIDFAYPTQVIYTASAGASPASKAV